MERDRGRGGEGQAENANKLINRRIDRWIDVFDVPFESLRNEMAVSCFYVLSQEGADGADPREQPDMGLNSITQ